MLILKFTAEVQVPNVFVAQQLLNKIRAQGFNLPEQFAFIYDTEKQDEKPKLLLTNDSAPVENPS